MLLDHWEVMVVIEMLVGEKDGWEVHKVGKVVTREWRKASSAELEIAFVSAFRDNSSFGLNILGPLCLWQCFFISVAATQYTIGPRNNYNISS